MEEAVVRTTPKDEVTTDGETTVVVTTESAVTEVVMTDMATASKDTTDEVSKDVVATVAATADEKSTGTPTEDEITTDNCTPDSDTSTDEETTDKEVSDVLRCFIDIEVDNFKKDKFRGEFIFDKPLKKFERNWLLKYLKDVHELGTKNIEIEGSKVIEVYKPNYKGLVYLVLFNPLIAKLLHECYDLFVYQPDNHLTHNSADINKYMNMLDDAGIDCTKPVLSQFKINPQLIEWRKALPIWPYRKIIMEHVVTNQVTIITGGPGVGKSTQVPQYIYEYMASCARESSLVCVHPYRVVAMTIAKRIALERGEAIGGSIGYQVPNRYNHRADTSLKFCTSEMLLRTILNGDTIFEKVTHVVVDNIDIRDKHTDYLLLCLRECLVTFPKLRLVLLSGAYDNNLFVEYFSGAPIVSIPGPNNAKLVAKYYLDDVYQILNREPSENDKRRLEVKCGDVGEETKSISAQSNSLAIDLPLVKDLVRDICMNKGQGGILVFLPSYEDIKDLQKLIMGDPNFEFLLFDLFFIHRMLDTSAQISVFRDNGCRKIVLATSVAEYSYFIPNIRFVIDTGIVWKTEFVDGPRLETVTTQWISKESAHRRINRLGMKNSLGLKCFRTYTCDEYDAMTNLHIPDMLTAPITDLVLLTPKIAPENYPITNFFGLCPERPPNATVISTIKYLQGLGALKENETLTSWGNIMGHLPLEPHLTKILMYALAMNCVQPVVTLVTFMSLRGPWSLPALPEEQISFANQLTQYSCGANSDHIALIQLFSSWSKSKDGTQFCSKHFLREGMMELVTIKRYELLMHLKRCQFLHHQLHSTPLERNENGHSWPVIKACLTAGLSPQFAIIDSKNDSINTNTKDNVKIGEQSVAYQKLHTTTSRWIIYEDDTPDKGISNITPVNTLTLLLFGTNCSMDIKKLAGSEKPISVSRILLNNWVQFIDQQKLLEVIFRIRRRIEDNLLFYITLPIFESKVANLIFKIICGALKLEDIPGDGHVPMSIGDKPEVKPLRLNYARQPFGIPQCFGIYCPDVFYFQPVDTVYKPYKIPVLSEEEFAAQKELDEIDVVTKTLENLKLDGTPNE